MASNNCPWQILHRNVETGFRLGAEDNAPHGEKPKDETLGYFVMVSAGTELPN